MSSGFDVAMKKQFPIISFEHASFQYEGQSQESLKDVKLIIKSGEFLVITGQSGCGKTTLTRCINNLIPRFFEGRLSGEVIVLGRSIKESDAGEAGKEIASIFQDPRSQFFTTNSSSEVAFACENYGIPHKEIVKRVNSAFQSLNMENLKDRDIFALSSGERQKVAFLAATTLNPQIYVLDEPSANLDIHTILQVREILSALKAAGHTIIVSVAGALTAGLMGVDISLGIWILQAVLVMLICIAVANIGSSITLKVGRIGYMSMVLIMGFVMGIMTVFIKSTLAAGYSIMGGFINLNAGTCTTGIIAAFIAVLISMYIYYLAIRKLVVRS